MPKVWRLTIVSKMNGYRSCGACWAITAVETIESAIFIATGRLYTLSETEIILCATECEMCAGGWPQEAIDYVVQHKGVPLRDDVPYNSDWLLKISNVKAGTSDELKYVMHHSFFALSLVSRCLAPSSHNLNCI